MLDAEDKGTKQSGSGSASHSASASASSWWLLCFKSCVSLSSPAQKESLSEKLSKKSSESATTPMKQPGGWKAIPYILGNETFERLASFGLVANFMVYLTRELHLDQVYASNILNIWSGITNFAPLVGAFISDAYVGRFRTIAFASFASLLTLEKIVANLQPRRKHPELTFSH